MDSLKDELDRLLSWHRYNEMLANCTLPMSDVIMQLKRSIELGQHSKGYWG